MNRLDLSGQWIMTRRSDGKELPAVIPGTDFGTLIRCGEIADPLRSGAEEEALAVASDQYTFSRRFTVKPEQLRHNKAKLKCFRVDTLCDILVNGQKALSLNNAYIPLDADIKAFLREGENTIAFAFSSPYLYIRDRYREKPLLPNPNGVNGIPYIRKPGCHFGWDWGPCVPYCGILDDPYIEFTDKEPIGIRIRQKTTPDKAVVTVTAGKADDIRLLSPSGESISGEDGVFTVIHPELWRIREQNGKELQPLYTVVVTNGEERTEKKIGLRSLSLSTAPDRYGKDFCFVLNGERVFAKGANLIPFSALFEDSSRKKTDYYLRLAVDSGFNMLRVWGGGSYADEYFLSRCDELGILVWQDFCFACQLYPFYEEDFAAGVLREIAVNVARMDPHPCVALFCGNNEAEQMFPYLPKSSALVSSYIDFFYKRLPPLLKELTEIPYIPSSPVGDAPFRNTGSDKVGDTHMWHVWHGLKPLDYYASRYTRFMSEFGLESLPSEKAIATFAGPSERSMDAEPFMRHQKCRGGNEKMLYYLTEMFGLPASFDALPYLTGIVQAECVKNAAVHFRQNRERCSGCLFWQYNDVWNCPSWSAVDFEGVPKALMVYAKRFFAPVNVTVRREKDRLSVFAHNDTLTERFFDAVLTYYDIGGEALGTFRLSAGLPKNTTRQIGSIPYGGEPVLRTLCNGELQTELFVPPVRAGLRKTSIGIKKTEGGILLTSDTFAYNICLMSDAAPSDNWFSMVKGEERFIAFDREPQELKLICANDLTYQSAEERKKFRRRYRLKPENMINTVVYSFT